MRIIKDKRPLIISIAVCIFEIALIYFTFYYYYNSAIITELSGITWNNVFGELVNDCIAMLTVPAFLIVLYRKNMALFRLNFNSKWEVFILSAVMILLFVLHNDFTIKGFYNLFFFFLIIGFAEEFIFRGFVYNILKDNSRALAIIISGSFWGIGHAVLPSITKNKDIVEILLSIPSLIVIGIIFGFYFIYLLEKSRTLWIPILVHAILDYSVGPIGIIVAFGIFIYLLLKSKKKGRLYMTY